ncbi:HD domain-containing protein [Candidatus Peregrinibacteria bacterium]|nr:HD domain-containing protein [Candidatus Peregrinibacteria bacterium]
MEDIEQNFQRAIQSFARPERERIERALAFAKTVHADQTREDGTPYAEHPIAVALILCAWDADSETIQAALLHDVLEDSFITHQELERRFGPTVASLVEGVTKFTQADMVSAAFDRKIETLRKLLEIMRRDIRAMLIKLADRLHNIRTIAVLPKERQERLARETLEIYGIIARHLSMNDLEREFGEVCVPILSPAQAEEFVQMRRRSSPKIRAIATAVEESVQQQAARGELQLVRSDARSMQYLLQLQAEGKLSDEQTFTLVLLVRDEDACYAILRILHALYRPVGSRFRDFIAAPTESGSQGISTTVIGPENSLLEVRIRTQEMDVQQRLGIVRSFFGGTVGSPGDSWIRRSQALDQSTRESSEAFWTALQSDLLHETVNVTVDGNSLSLAAGSTALDAAYAQLGKDAHRVTAIDRNGSVARLSSVLSDDDVLRITLGKEGAVSFERFQDVVSSFARNLITEALKQRSREEKIRVGSQLLQKEFDHFKRGLIGEIAKSQQHDVAAHFRRESFEEVVAMVGEGVLEARDIVFHLFPEHRAFSFRAAPVSHLPQSFRLHVRGMQSSRQDVLQLLTGIARIEGIQVRQVDVVSQTPGTFDLFLRGRAPDRAHFAEFLTVLEHQEWISHVDVLLSPFQRLLLFGSFTLAFAVIVLDVLLLPYYEQLFGTFSMLPLMFVQVLPLLPIVGANYYLLKLLRHYIVRMRQDQWFLGLGFLLNILGLILLISHGIYARVQTSLLPLVGVFILSLLYTEYRCIQSQALFTEINQEIPREISQKQRTAVLHRKTVGYVIRVLAVLIWGIEPIYIRYTPVNVLSPFLRTFLLSIGVLVPTGCILIVRSLLRRRRPRLRLPYDHSFVLLVLGQAGYMYLKNASLIYTSGTNLLLFNNFSPVMGLLIASIFWRKDIPYLRQPKTMSSIFLLAVISAFASSLIFFNDVQHSSATALGDILAMISTFFDVLLTVGQIQYIKKFARTDGLLLNVHVFFFLLLFVSPAILLLLLAHRPVLAGLTLKTFFLGMGIGLFVGTGQLLNYEAFKRIDGYLAFMLFNLSVIVTFSMETFLLHSVRPTVVLLLSTMLIMISSVAAEFINSRAERRV